MTPDDLAARAKRDAERRERERRETLRARERVAEVRALLSRPTPEPYTHETLDRHGAPFSLHKSAERAEHDAERIRGSVIPYVPRKAR